MNMYRGESLIYKSWRSVYNKSYRWIVRNLVWPTFVTSRKCLKKPLSLWRNIICNSLYRITGCNGMAHLL